MGKSPSLFINLRICNSTEQGVASSLYPQQKHTVPILEIIEHQLIFRSTLYLL
jgi:hypothetical protein